MREWIAALGFGSATIVCDVPVVAESPRIEVSSDGYEVVVFYNLGVPLAFADGFESGDTSPWSATVP